MMPAPHHTAPPRALRTSNIGMAVPQEEGDTGRSVLPAVAVRMALLALKFYKTYLSFLFAGSCRFQPTCSQYTYEAIERFGLTRGVWLGLKRLLRCHPLSRKFGYDPVPERDNECTTATRESGPAIFPKPPAETATEVHS
jgi:uncharacterized protein